MATAAIDRIEPYRDPRTAFGNDERMASLRNSRRGSIPVGDVVDLTGKVSPQDIGKVAQEAAPAAAPAAAPGATPAAPQAAKPAPGRVVGVAGTLKAAAPALGVAATALPEAMDIGRVAADRGASKIDVATQTAEGVSRTAASLAGAAGGAKAGAAVAPFLGPLAPAAPVVGGVVGGALGYFGANAAVKGGRAMAGVDTASPVDRAPDISVVPTAQAAAVPPAAAQSAPAASAPVARAVSAAPAVSYSDARQGPPIPPEYLQPAASQAASPAGTITRKGNSYSGNDIAAGATIDNPRNPRAGVSVVNTSEGYRQDLLELARNAEERRQQDVGQRVVSIAGPAETTREQDLRATTDRGKVPRGVSSRRLAAMAAYANAQTSQQAAQQNAELTRRAQDIGASTQQLSNETQRRGQDIGAVSSRYAADEAAAARRDVAAEAAAARRDAAAERANSIKVAPGGQLPYVDPVSGETKFYTVPARVFKGDQEIGVKPPAAESQYTKGQTYTDAKGNKATWDGTKFVPAK